MKKAGHVLLFRYIITHLLILSIPMSVSLLYYHVTKRTQEQTINEIVQTQLNSDSAYIEQKLRDINKQIETLLVDYELNRYLNTGPAISDIDLYNTRRISARLSSLVSGGEFFSRSFLYMKKTDLIISDNGIAPFDSFFTHLFDARGFTPNRWKQFIEQDETPVLKSGLYISEGSHYQYSHLLINRIGKGDFYRGSLVSVLDSEELGKRMTRLPELYGGWLIILDNSGKLISSTGSFEQGMLLAEKYHQSKTLKNLKIDERDYRIFSRHNPGSQWHYIAFMDEKFIYDKLVKIRNRTLILLSGAFLVSLFFSLLMAYFNYQPIERLFHIINLPPQKTVLHYSSLFLNLEKNVSLLTENNKKMAKEIETAEIATQSYFLQNLLGGKYRNRERYDRDRQMFDIPLDETGYCILVARLSPMALTMDSLNTGDMISALIKQFSLHTKEGEFVIRSGSGEIAVILKLKKKEERIHTQQFIDKVTRELKPEWKEHLLIGIGTPLEDSFLLSLSYNEAEIACTNIGEKTRLPVCFFADIPVKRSGYEYPLHLEEAIIRAVKTSHTELLTSMRNKIFTLNFSDGQQSLQESENLVRAITGTAYRITADPSIQTPSSLRYKLGIICDTETPEKAVKELFRLFQEVAENVEKGCKKNATRIIEEIRKFINENFSDYNLGVSMIADRFNLSENYLSSLFKENEGIKLSTCILKTRMEKAVFFLKNHPEMSIDTISHQCGYPNTSSFRRAFRRLYNQPPSEFRERT